MLLFVISLSAALSAQTSWEAAFQGSTGTLWVVNNSYYTSAAATNTGLAMMAGTSPSITGLTNGGYAVAFQGPTGNLWVYDSVSGGTEFGLGMMAGTSPAITVGAGGTWEAAFQADTGSLWEAETGGAAKNLGLGMMAGTSPSITTLTNGTYAYAFQANTGSLWVNGVNYNLGMMAGTSPGIAALTNGGYEVAFQTNTGYLWWVTTGDADITATGFCVEKGTSPNIVYDGDGFVVVFACGEGSLSLLFEDGGGYGIPLGNTVDSMAGTSPSITMGPDGAWVVAYQDASGDLFVTDSVEGALGATQLAMKAGTSPSIAWIP